MTRLDVIRHLLTGLPRKDVQPTEVFAPANIALVKYWGKRDAELNLPVTSSLSISLAGKGTRVRLASNGTDRLVINGATVDPAAGEFRRMFGFIDPLRGPDGPRLLVDTVSTIPIAAGLASSASAFAAVVKAMDTGFGWKLPVQTQSVLARIGSGSASRSIFEGFVEWHAGSRPDGLDSFAEPLAAVWPEFRIGVLKISSAVKKIGSRDGMNRTTAESALYQAWPAQVARDLAEVKAAIAGRDLNRLGAAAECNALSMHGTMLGCRPAVVYFLPESIQAIHRVHRAREAGVPVYLTMDAGPNVKLIFTAEAEDQVRREFPEVDVVRPFGG